MLLDKRSARSLASAVQARKTCGFPRSRASPYHFVICQIRLQAADLPFYFVALLIAYLNFTTFLLAYIGKKVFNITWKFFTRIMHKMTA